MSETGFLTALDRELVQWDFRRAVKEHAGIEVTDATVLYRPFAPRSFGGAWQWLEADRETVLSTVPVDYFAEAVATAS